MGAATVWAGTVLSTGGVVAGTMVGRSQGPSGSAGAPEVLAFGGERLQSVGMGSRSALGRGCECDRLITTVTNVSLSN